MKSNINNSGNQALRFHVVPIPIQLNELWLGKHGTIASATKYHNREWLLKTVWTGDARDKSVITTDVIQCVTSSCIIIIMRITGSDNGVNQLFYSSAGVLNGFIPRSWLAGEESGRERAGMLKQFNKHFMLIICWHTKTCCFCYINSLIILLDMGALL